MRVQFGLTSRLQTSVYNNTAQALKPKLPVFGTQASDETQLHAAHHYAFKVFNAFEERLKQAGYQALSPIMPSNTQGRPNEQQLQVEKLYGLKPYGNYLPKLHVLGIMYSNNQEPTMHHDGQQEAMYESKDRLDQILKQLPELTPLTQSEAQAKLHAAQYEIPTHSEALENAYVLDATTIPGFEVQPKQNQFYLVRLDDEKPFAYGGESLPSYTESDQKLVKGFGDFLKSLGIGQQPYLNYFMQPNSLGTPIKTAPLMMVLDTTEAVEGLKQQLLKTGVVKPAHHYKRALEKTGVQFIQPTPKALRLKQQLGMKLLGDQAQEYYIPRPPYDHVDSKQFFTPKRNP